MAILAYDDMMLREPRMLVPRQQPLGPVKINWNHPLTAGLKAAFIGSQGFVGTNVKSEQKTVVGGNVFGYAGMDKYIPALDVPEACAMFKLYSPSDPNAYSGVELGSFYVSGSDRENRGFIWHDGTSKATLFYTIDNSGVNSGGGTESISFPYQYEGYVATNSTGIWRVPKGSTSVDLSSGPVGAAFHADNRKRIAAGYTNWLCEYAYFYVGVAPPNSFAIWADPYCFFEPA